MWHLRGAQHNFVGIAIHCALGAALWVGVWTTLGYLSGSNINTIYDTATRFSTYLAIAVAVLVLSYITLKVVKVRRARAEADA